MAVLEALNVEAVKGHTLTPQPLADSKAFADERTDFFRRPDKQLL